MGIYIALGSNLGDRAGNLRQALEELQKQGLKLVRVSSFRQTRPYGVTDQPDFLNAVAQVETKLPPVRLLQLLLQVEQKLGRVRRRHWGERNIDLDLLLYHDIILHSPTLTLPHPDMLNRDFVLVPLAEIAPEVIHPVVAVSIGSLAAKFINEGS